MKNVVTILSHFHAIYGPLIFLTYPNIDITPDIQNIQNALDLKLNEGFFETEDAVRTINYNFTIRSDRGRGGGEMLLLSYIMTETDAKAESYKPKMLIAVQRMKDDRELWTAFYEDREDKGKKHKDKLLEILKDLDIDLRSTEVSTVGYLSNGRDIYEKGFIPVPKTIKEEKEGRATLEEACKRKFLTVFKENPDHSFTIRAYSVNANVYKLEVYTDKVDIFTPRVTTIGIQDTLKGEVIATSGICQGKTVCTLEVYFAFDGKRELINDFCKKLKTQIASDSKQYPLVLCSPLELETVDLSQYQALRSEREREGQIRVD